MAGCPACSAVRNGEVHRPSPCARLVGRWRFALFAVLSALSSTRKFYSCAVLACNHVRGSNCPSSVCLALVQFGVHLFRLFLFVFGVRRSVRNPHSDAVERASQNLLCLKKAFWREPVKNPAVGASEPHGHTFPDKRTRRRPQSRRPQHTTSTIQNFISYLVQISAPLGDHTDSSLSDVRRSRTGAEYWPETETMGAGVRSRGLRHRYGRLTLPRCVSRYRATATSS